MRSLPLLLPGARMCFPILWTSLYHLLFAFHFICEPSPNGARKEARSEGISTRIFPCESFVPNQHKYTMPIRRKNSNSSISERANDDNEQPAAAAAEKNYGQKEIEAIFRKGTSGKTNDGDFLNTSMAESPHIQIKRTGDFVCVSRALWPNALVGTNVCDLCIYHDHVRVWVCG